MEVKYEFEKWLKNQGITGTTIKYYVTTYPNYLKKNLGADFYDITDIIGLDKYLSMVLKYEKDCCENMQKGYSLAVKSYIHFLVTHRFDTWLESKLK